MAIRNNRTCLCDKTRFGFCPECSKADALKPSWASQFCSEDCMTIWTTAVKFNLGKISKAEAKSIISTIPLKPIEQYVACIQRDLGVILAEDPKPKRGKRTHTVVLDEVVPEVVIEENKDAIIDCNIHEVVEIIENE